MAQLQKTTLIIVSTVALTAALYWGRTFLIPLLFGGLFAMLFTPMALWLRRQRVPRLLAVILCVLTLITALGIFAGALFWQGNALANNWPEIEQKVVKKSQQIYEWSINHVNGLSKERLNTVSERLAQQQETWQKWITNFMGNFFGSLTNSILALIYMTFLMLATDRITEFGLRVAPADQRDRQNAFMQESRNLVARFFVGRLILALIQCLIFSVGFLIFGLQYAIPVGILAGIFTFIPYIGNIIGGLLALLIALATGGGTTVYLGVIGTMVVGQVLENNILSPWIVGREVNLNPFFTFTSIIAFSLIWGIAGTILAIPLVAVAKKYCEYQPTLKPYGYLMGLDK